MRLRRSRGEHAAILGHPLSTPLLRHPVAALSAGVECERFRPHVCLFDVDMAGDNTEAVCRAIHETDELQATRLVAVTARLTEGQMAHLADQGFVAILRKATGGGQDSYYQGDSDGFHF